MNRKTLATTVMLAAILIAALAVAPLAGAAPAQQAANVLRIGYLGGPETDTANGARLAIDQINGAGGVTAADGTVYLLDLLTLAEPPTDVSFVTDVEAMLAQSVVALLGPDNAVLLTPENLQFLVDRGVPVLTGATEVGLTNSDTSDTLIRLRASEEYYSAALAAYLTNDLGLSSLAVVQTGALFTAAVEGFEASLADSGIVPAPKVELADNSTLSQQTPVLLEANPEAVVVWGTMQDASTVLRKLRAGGWTGVFVFRQAEEAARFGVFPPDVLEGVVGVTSWSYGYTDRASRNFLNDYIVAFGAIPGPLAAAAYDAVWVLRSAVGSAGTETTALSAGILAFGPQNIVGGSLSPATYGNGDLTHVAMVYRLNSGGGPEIVALYDNNVRQSLVDSGP